MIGLSQQFQASMVIPHPYCIFGDMCVGVCVCVNTSDRCWHPGSHSHLQAVWYHIPLALLCPFWLLLNNQLSSPTWHKECIINTQMKLLFINSSTDICTFLAVLDIPCHMLKYFFQPKFQKNYNFLHKTCLGEKCRF